MKFLKNLRTRFRIFFRNYYEARLSLPWGITRFVANIAFIQLSNDEYIELAPQNGFGNASVSVLGARPILTYSVFVEEWENVQVIIELDRGFQLRQEKPESIVARLDVMKANAVANRPEDMKPMPAPEFLDWELTTIDNPRLTHLKDIFLAFGFYPAFTAGMKRKVTV